MLYSCNHNLIGSDSCQAVSEDTLVDQNTRGWAEGEGAYTQYRTITTRMLLH